MIQVLMPKDIKGELCSDEMSGTEVEVRGVKYVVHELLGKGDTGVTRKCTDDIGGEFAIKFVAPQVYKGRSYLAEVAKARKLRNCPNIARLEGWDTKEIELPHSKRRESFVCFITEYVKGDVLQDYLCDRPISPSFLKAFVDGLCEALHAMRYHGLHHNDMHNCNIMICAVPEESLDQEGKIVKVIDTGLVTSFSAPVQDKMDDHTHFVRHLTCIYNSILDNRHNLRVPDKKYLNSVKAILNSMVDDDIQRRLYDPRRIKEEFDRVWSEAYAPAHFREEKLYLSSPFDYIQAEHIASDHVLNALFSDKCPWYEKVRGPDPINLDGPRGCGKSTVFRMLRLKTLLHTKTLEEVLELSEIGFYIPCSLELQSRFAYLTEETTSKVSPEIIHYFNLVLIGEIVDTLREISLREDAATAFGWTDQIDRDFHAFLLDQLGMPERKADRLNGISRLDHLRGIFDAERMETHRCILRENNLGWTTPPSLLAEVTKYLHEQIRYFRDKQILFLLDDYSLHRVPSHIQRILNRVIWTQVPTYVFKISSEVGGVVAEAPLGGTADVSREFEEVNSGLEYLNIRDQKENHKFIEDVLNRRLSLAGYQGDAAQLLSRETLYPNSMSLGAALRAEKRKELPGQPVYYHGLECIANLCSGDIATTLDIVRHIFQKAGVDAVTTSLIRPRQQHDAIQDFSRSIYSKIGEYLPYGQEMQKLVHAFGWFSRTLLCEHPGVRSRGEGRFDPYEMIRIDIEEDPSQPGLPELHEQILRELLRRAIFIELPKGRSRRGAFTRRLQLRRAYCPAFKTSLTHSEPLHLTREQFRYLLDSPREVCENHLANKLGKKTALRRELNQLPMFELLEGGG